MIHDTAVHPHPTSPLKGEGLDLSCGGFVPSPLRGEG